MSSTLIILGRHGDEKQNKLTTHGIGQSEELADRLHTRFNTQRVLVCSSTVDRARETARIIATRFNTEIIPLVPLGQGIQGHTADARPLLETLQQRSQQAAVDVIIGITHTPAIREVFEFLRDTMRWPVDRMPFQGEAMILDPETKSLTII